MAAGLVVLGLAVAVGWALLVVRDRGAGWRRRSGGAPRRARGLVTLLVLAGRGRGQRYVGYAPD